MKTALLALSLFVLAGCVAGGAADASVGDAEVVHCPGARPPVSACTSGVASVDCGGDGEPRFACSFESGRCAWFATSCVASGWEASDCAAGALCCHPTRAGGTWPFADEWRPSPAALVSQTVEDIAMLGGAVVTPTTPTTIDVVLDPSVTAPTAGSVTCDPGIALPFCGAPIGTGLGRVGASVALLIDATNVHPPEWLTLEIVSADGAVPDGARAFLEVVHDADGPGAASPSCALATSPRANISGTITLNRYDPEGPAGMHGHAELDVDGLPATIVF